MNTRRDINQTRWLMAVGVLAFEVLLAITAGWLGVFLGGMISLCAGGFIALTAVLYDEFPEEGS